MKFRVISFYRYCGIDTPEQLRDEIQARCEKLGILGRILIGKEGINGACSGELEKTEEFKQYLQGEFEGLTFREQDYDSTTYHRLVVRVRDEICAFGAQVDLSHKGEYVEPEELKAMYEKGEEFVIVDARNDYEFDVGKFKNAVKLPIKTFREFPAEIEKHAEWKDKKVVLYCTGGIRCEKASAYMKEQGFKDVNHLKGGIINYVNKFPDAQWEGGLFVFDDRLVSDVGDNITHCEHCEVAEKQYQNCHNLDCDRLFICCEGCREKFATCCSEKCRDSPRQRTVKEQEVLREVVGVVENYYTKLGVALLKLDKEVRVGEKVIIEGKTTKVEQEIQEMRDDDGLVIDHASNGLVTVPIKDKVRKNDLVLMEG